MAGSSNAERRLAAFVDDRVGATGGASEFASETAAELRHRALREYREVRAAPPGAGLAADETKPNWVSIGPYAVLNGQADTNPVVSGRVPSLAVSGDGRRVYVGSANGGVWRSTDAARTWQPMSDELELNPTAASVDSLACGALALVEGAGPATDRLYVGTGEATASLDWMPTGFLGAGMLRSDDGGTTWHAEPGRATAASSTNDLLGQGVYAIAVDPGDRDLALAATTAGLFTRRPGGDWLLEALPALPDARVTSVVVRRQGGTTTWVAARQGGQVVRGAPGAWTPLQTIPATSGTLARVTLAMAPSAPVVYAFSAKTVPVVGGTSTQLNAVHRMDLSLAVPRWVRLTGGGGIPAGLTGAQGWYDQGIVVDPFDPNRIYVAGSGINVGVAPAFNFVAAIYRVEVTPPVGAATTTAAAATHIGRAVHADVHDLVLRPGSDELWVGCDGGVFVTRNARGAPPVFASCNTGLGTLTLTGLTAHPAEETWAFAGAQDNGGLRYDGWEVWDHQLGGDGGATVLDPGSSRILNIFNTDTVRRAAIAGARYASTNVPPPSGGNARFYPPMEQSPAQPTFVVFGANRPFVTNDFGNNWSGIAGLPGITVSDRIRSIAVVSNVLFYVGWGNGRVARYTRPTAASAAWTVLDYSRPGETRPVAGMVIDPDPAQPGGRAIYVCLGGAGPSSVWHLDTSIDDADPTTPPTGWKDRSNVGGAVGTRLLPLHHSAILADPSPGNHRRLWVAADLGVWTSADAGATWSELSWNLPDAAVLDLDLVTVVDSVDPAQSFRLLRASTHGRGVFEMPLGGIAQPPVELMLRANQLDQRRRRPRAAVPLPAAPATQTRLDQSPDLYVDTPDANGQYRLRPDRPPTVTELAELPPLAEILASVVGAPALTRVHVIVRNRGVRRVDGVRVTLLVGPKDATLPDSYRSCARGGPLTAANGWQLAGFTEVNGLRAGEPLVATIALSSESIPELSVSVGQDYQLIALLHHGDDPFPLAAPADTLVPSEVVSRVRQSAMKAVRVVSGRGRAAPSGGTGMLVSLSTTLLAQRRLTAITASLGAKVGAAGTVHPVERRVLALARAGLTNLQAGPKPRVPAGTPGAQIGSYALLGALGFELPAYTSAFLPGGGWVAENLRRGTGDPHLSNVAVSATELPLKLAKTGLPGSSATTNAALRAFATGLLAAAAAGATLSPQLADLLSQDTQADWHPRSRSRGASALEHVMRRDVLGGSAGVTSLSPWLPPAADVPPALWEKYVGAIEQTYHLPGQRSLGFGSFEADLDPGYWINARRLAGGYGVLLDEVRATSWSAWPWWGLLSPILLAPSVALLVARSLPHARAFTDGGELSERSFFELLTLAMGIGAIAPFTYSMLMWSQVSDHGEAFGTSLLMGLARGALVGAGLGTASDEGQEWAVRWGALFLPLAGADTYAAIRSAADSGRHPGNAKVFALQTLPALTGITTLGLAGLARTIGGEATERDTAQDDTVAWSLALGTGALLLGAVGIPVALALSRGGGWQSWFIREHGHLPLLSATAHAGVEPLSPTAAARVFENPSLWPALGVPVALDQQHYPAGMRQLVRVWWTGTGELKLRYGGTTLHLRHDGTESAVDLADPTSATTLVTQIEAALPGLKAELVGTDTPALDLPRPMGLADAGDTAWHEAAEPLRTSFVRVPTRKGGALLLRAAPRVEQSATAGRTAPAATPYLVFPADPTRDDPGSGLIDAADLAALLVTAAAPSMGTVVVDDGRPALPVPAVGEVTQVFRRWNLDERRLDEWRSLVTGHGATVPPADPVRGGQNMLVRTHATAYAPQPGGRDVAEAMGWLPLWRAWLGVAGDPAANAGDNAIHAGTPQVAFPVGPPRKPTNRELTDGIRFLLDLGDT